MSVYGSFFYIFNLDNIGGYVVGIMICWLMRSIGVKWIESRIMVV